MAKKKTGTGSAKRYTTRYGKSNRQKVGNIEAESRKKHKCPYCNALRVKRITYGIWNCTKCEKKFSGKAYIPAKIKTQTAEVENGNI